MTTEHKTTPAPRWVWHTDDFASLMLGRIQLAQVSKATETENWFYTLFNIRPGERSGYSAPTQAEAMAACEEHTRKALADVE